MKSSLIRFAWLGRVFPAMAAFASLASGFACVSSETTPTSDRPSCSLYCDRLEKVCPIDENKRVDVQSEDTLASGDGKKAFKIGVQQYPSRAECIRICEQMPIGEPNAKAGDSLNCRLSQLALLETEPGSIKPVNREGATPETLLAKRCIEAGAFSSTCSAGGENGVCSTFCRMSLADCPTAFTSEADCLTTCKAFPRAKPPTKNPSEATIFVEPGFADAKFNGGERTNEASFSCHAYHLTVASVNPDPHCGHIKGGNPCSEPAKR
jgi:hypothetical protein